MTETSEKTKGGLVFVGIQGSVVALRKDDGAIAWATKLRKGSTLVALVVEPSWLFAASGGEVSCLDPDTGAVLWHNSLDAYGDGHAVLGASPGRAASGLAEVVASAARAASAAGI